MKGILAGVALGVVMLAWSSMAQASGQKENVVLLMLDGVRWQEVFNGVDPDLSSTEYGQIFTHLWGSYGREGVLFGDHGNASTMTISNPDGISLPGYQSIMAGFAQPCHSNNCGRTQVETVQERLVRELGLAPSQVATIASWEQIPYAVEHIAGSTFVNAGFTPLDDGTSDPVIERINYGQAADAPKWHGARADRYTFAHAMHYLEKHRPRFLFISLNDADEWGHANKYANYLTTLRQYDLWIEYLIRKLDSLGEYGQNTTLLVTTDHGRGNGFLWQTHGFWAQGSQYVWMFARGPHAARNAEGGAGHEHADLRPSIEALLGIKPQECSECGSPIPELFSRQ